MVEDIMGLKEELERARQRVEVAACPVWWSFPIVNIYLG